MMTVAIAMVRNNICFLHVKPICEGPINTLSLVVTGKPVYRNRLSTVFVRLPKFSTKKEKGHYYHSRASDRGIAANGSSVICVPFTLPRREVYIQARQIYIMFVGMSTGALQNTLMK